MAPAMQGSASPTSAILTFAALVLLILAVVRSPKKIRTALYIVGATLGCGLIGAGIGFAMGSPRGAGGLAGFAMQIGMIVASIERIRRNRRAGPQSPVRL
jgi:hypothetical protein